MTLSELMTSGSGYPGAGVAVAVAAGDEVVDAADSVLDGPVQNFWYRLWPSVTPVRSALICAVVR